MGTCGELLGCTWGYLGTSWEAFGVHLGTSGDLLGSSGGAFGTRFLRKVKKTGSPGVFFALPMQFARFCNSRSIQSILKNGGSGSHLCSKLRGLGAILASRSVQNRPRGLQTGSRPCQDASKTVQAAFVSHLPRDLHVFEIHEQSKVF